ncbi:MAG: glycoside hydrolase family 32 protein [Ruminococcaceae bacterium]|nr:glycoside hydrolase family 32 protein [Oscillospiraceae bacterium]
MKIKIEKKYLIFPVNVLTSKKKVTFSNDGQTVYELMMNLDNRNPDFSAYVDVSRFIGRELELTVKPDMEIRYRTSDEMDIDGLYNELVRPQVHFTTKNGWNNDPNGLIYLDGTYHMFYQHNPCSPEWENMHWGHSTSSDLIHWTEQPIALFPDETGMMYSGSAILDTENVTGLGTKENPPALLYYTATAPFSQHLAYSVDGFKTIKKYKNNPVLNHICRSNRDPKVVFCDEMKSYLMVIYLEKDIYGFFQSKDLISWTLFQKLSLSGDNECPDIFSVVASNGEKKWVLMGAHNRYIVGSMSENGFTPEQETRSLHYGSSAYAGQTFSGMPDGRVVRIDWDRWQAVSKNFKGQMSIPLELTLAEKDGVYYLSALPVKEIETLYTKMQKYSDIEIRENSSVSYDLEKSPYVVKLQVKNTDDISDFTIKIFGRDIVIKPSENELKFVKETVPLSIFNGSLDITLVIDRCSIEAFLDCGKIYASFLNNNSVQDYNVPFIEISSKGSIKIDELMLIALNSMWNEK